MWWSIFATESEGAYYPTTLGYVVMVAVMLLCIGLALYFGSRQAKRKVATKQLVFSAAAMALATVTSNLKIIDMPFGGSITLFSMLFICLIGYWYGAKAGLMTAFAYGMLQLIIDPYIISIPQLLIDYPLAFGALGLSGLFSEKKHGLLTGYLVGVFGRFVFAFLSGYIFFGMYAPEGMHPAAYSFLYNGAYIGGEAVLTAIVLAIPAVEKGLLEVKNIALSQRGVQKA